MLQVSAQDFIDRVGEREALDLTDPDRVLIDPERINRAIGDAESEIAAILAAKYSALELLRPCAYLNTACLTIARKNLDMTVEPRRHVFEDYKLVIERLEAIAKGESGLIFDEDFTQTPPVIPDPGEPDPPLPPPQVQILFSPGFSHLANSGFL